MDKNTAIMYRVEHVIDGGGPFTTRLSNGKTRSHLYVTHKNDDVDMMIGKHELGFPCIYQDSLNIEKYGMDWFCAYKDMSTLREFISPKAFEALSERGFKLYEYTASKYQEGSMQYIFVKEFAEKREIDY